MIAALLYLAPQHDLKLEIPKASWVSLYFEEIDRRAAISGLGSLRALRLPPGDEEIRVWIGFGHSMLHGFVLSKTGGRWYGKFLMGIEYTAFAPDYAMWVPRPKIGWGRLMNRLESGGIYTLPDEETLPKQSMTLDGVSYVVEYQRNGSYRTYCFSNPETVKDVPEYVRFGKLMGTLERHLWPNTRNWKLEEPLMVSPRRGPVYFIPRRR